MPNFLNLKLDGKLYKKFLLKHILFTAFWTVGILLFIFRIDIFFLKRYSISYDWLTASLPTLYFVLMILMFFLQKWYYSIAFIFYPFLIIFWFLPKTVLSVGKIYLFGSYFTALFSRLLRFKIFILNSFLFLISTILLVTIGSNWSRWLSITVISYFYIAYVIRFLKKSFARPALFSADIEERIKHFINNDSIENSFVIKSYVIQKDDEKLELQQRRETQMRRTILASYTIDLLNRKLTGYRGRQAYIVSWMFGAFTFLVISIIFFWFLNFQLYKINNSNFIYTGIFPSFDFLYYTLKTVTFGDIELIKPVSVLARISETTSFLTIGIFALVIVISVFLSLKQDKVNEDVKLTTEMFNSEHLTLSKYMQEEFGMEIKNAMSEIKNIDTSLKNLKNFIDKVF